jgi:leucyl/phenylalanyl-tRNA--protein transferase
MRLRACRPPRGRRSIDPPHDADKQLSYIARVSWAGKKSPFDPERADEDGLVAVGGQLHPELVLTAYASGVFPWSSRPRVTWWSPDPRAVFDLVTWQPHRTIARSIRRAGWRFSVDEKFGEVMRACAAPMPGRESTWISPDFIACYEELHRRGFAHSVEVHEGEELVGGLYGVTIGGFFGGESMFHRKTDASKAATTHLMERLRACGFILCDAQVPNQHLMRLGAVEIPRKDYLARLAAALEVNATLT